MPLPSPLEANGPLDDDTAQHPHHALPEASRPHRGLARG